MIKLLASREVIPNIPSNSKTTRLLWETRPTSLIKQLSESTGCINATAIKILDLNTTLLATGGDDKFVRLYDTSNHQLIGSLNGHLSNIFCIQIADSSTILSCGNDGFLIHHDLTTGKRVTREAHSDAVLRLSIQAGSTNIVLTAGQDYKLKLWDLRSRDAQKVIRTSTKRQNYVEFNPTSPELFISCTDGGEMMLRDIRNLDGIAMQYDTNGDGLEIDLTSCPFSADGKLIGVNRQYLNPLIYTIMHPHPVALMQCESFSSYCTIKTPCFSTDHFFAGSDEDAYGWLLPNLYEVPETQYPIPIEASIKMCGHKSIVNSCLAHPTLPLVYTAGVERVVRIFGPFEPPEEVEEVEDDQNTIDLFDTLLARARA